MSKRGKKSILFICTGNTCRSPMATGYLTKLLEDHGVKNVDVKSAGVMTVAGLLPTQETVLLLEEVGVDIKKHRSLPLTPDIIRKSDIILGFTPFHVQSAIRLSDEARGKTFMLKEYVGGDPRRARIQDPMGCTLEVYRRVFNEITKACDKLTEKDEIFPQQEKKGVAKKAGGKSPAAAKATRKNVKKGVTKKKTVAHKKTPDKSKKSPAHKASSKKPSAPLKRKK